MITDEERRSAVEIQHQTILHAFRGEVPRFKVSFLYRLGLVVVAIAMILLPLIYLGLIVGVCYILVIHFQSNGSSLQNLGGKGVFLLFVVPLIVGGMLVFFMIKPLFARPEKSEDPFTLDPDNERFLFTFVAHLCRTIGAPEPKEIRIDSDVNASASFRLGLWSMLSSDLVLTIGLPLVSGMTLRQFSGVLAHEFGHFSQGAGMRLTYIIRSVSAWFARVVYERDSWDETLTEWSKDSDFRIMFILLIARFFIWVTRKILWVLMMIGHTISCFMLRQMEYDADRYEACLSGSGTFEESMRLVTTLSAAHHFALDHLSTSWNEGRLADDFPALVAMNLETLPDEVKKNIEEHISKGKTSFFATHPADMDRIQYTKSLNMKGVFAPDAAMSEKGLDGTIPASVLFSKYATLCKAISLKFYRANLGRQVASESLFPVENLLKRKETEEAGQKALHRYFQGHFSSIRSLKLPGQPPTANPLGIVQGEAMKDMRSRFIEALPSYQTCFKKYDDADTRVIEMGQALALIRANFNIDPKVFNLSQATRATASAQRKLAKSKQDGLDSELASHEELLKNRILAALEGVSVMASTGKGMGDAVKEMETLWPALQTLQANLGGLTELRNRHVALMSLCENLEDNADNESLIITIQGEMSQVRKAINELYEALGLVEYPFDHAKGRVALRDFAIGKLPTSNDLGGIVEVSSGALEKMYNLYARVMGRLVLIAERVESEVGLELLSDPKAQAE